MKVLNKIYYFFLINDLITRVIEGILNTGFTGKSLSNSLIFSCNFNSPFPPLLTLRIYFHT